MSDLQHNSQQDDKQDDKQNSNEGAKNQHLFLSLVTSMQMGAMYQLGKIASPISGKIERDLRQAQNTIDLLAMLQARTEGNLAADESEHLRRIISELRLNYIDESAKPDAPEESEDSTEESKGASASNETFADSADKSTTSE
ncbi:MAG: DUF1844 domain-containing protein, partial [candidate division Zixibacteria bacterium]|nr:DUF1844 domain-containing protein [candidate division Zixibacteria bacterium]